MIRILSTIHKTVRRLSLKIASPKEPLDPFYTFCGMLNDNECLLIT